MKTIEAIKSLTSISVKALNKDNPAFGQIGLVSKKNKLSLYFQSQIIQCLIPVDSVINFEQDCDFMIDGKVLVKALTECIENDLAIAVQNNSDNKPSGITLKSKEKNFSVTVPVSEPLSSFKQKKNSGKHFIVDKNCFVELIKSTTVAGNETDPERPYFYALINFSENNMSCICGNGTFFANASCSSSFEEDSHQNCLIPIYLVNNIIGLISQSSEKSIDFHIDDSHLIISSKDYKITISIDQKAVSWPDASPILKRKTGTNISVKSDLIKEVCNKIEIAMDAFSAKSETLKCNMSVKNKKMYFEISSICSIKCDVECEVSEECDYNLFFDAACLPLYMKSKKIGEITIFNIDDSSFNGRSSPMLLSSEKDGFLFKSFFAVNV